MIEVKNAVKNVIPSNKNKLRHIPKFELIKIINKMISKKSVLKSEILRIFNKNTKKPFKFVQKLSYEKSVHFLSQLQNLPEDLVDDLYKEYVETKNPSLFLSNIGFLKSSSNLIKKIKSSSKDIVEYVNETFKEVDEPTYQELSFLSFDNLDDEIIEIGISYEKRIDYVDPITQDPIFLYGLKQGTIWISPQQMSIIIMIDHYQIWNVIKKAFAKILKWKIQTFTLNKSVIDEIFGIHTLKRGNYYNPYPDEDEVSNKSISDTNLMNKAEGKKTNRTYRRRSSFHRLPDLFGFIDILVSINSAQGKISFRAEIKKSDLISAIHKLKKKYQILWKNLK